MNKPDSLTKSTLLLTVVGIVSQALAFFYRVVLSRLIGAETMGLYQLIMPVYSVIMSITISGLTVALSSLSAGYYSVGNRKATTQLLYSALRGLVLLWLPIALAVCIFSRPLSEQVLGDGRTRLGLMLLLPVLLLTGIENLNKHHFYGIGETRLPAMVEIAEQFIRTAAILGLLTLFLPLSQEHTVAVIVLGMIVSEIFSSTSLTIARRKREGAYRHQIGTPDRPKTIRRKLAKVAVPVSGAALLNNLISSADSVLIPQKLVLFGMSSSEAMELFGVVFGMTMPLLMLPFAFVNALCLALLPQLTQCAALNQREELNCKAAWALQSTSLVVLPLLALLVTLGGDVGKVLYREERVGLYILPLAVAVVFSGYESVLCSILNGVGKQTQSAMISLFCGLIQLGFTFFGVERFGLPACIAGMIIGSILGFALRLGLAMGSTGLQVDVFSSFFAPGLAAILSGLWVNLLYLAGQRYGLSDGAILILCSILGLGLYGLALSVQGIHPFGCFSRAINSSQSSIQRNRSS
jgi:O-antigen/teichoic acid export membrane protein